MCFWENLISHIYLQFWVLFEISRLCRQIYTSEGEDESKWIPLQPIRKLNDVSGKIRWCLSFELVLPITVRVSVHQSTLYPVYLCLSLACIWWSLPFSHCTREGRCISLLRACTNSACGILVLKSSVGILEHGMSDFNCESIFVVLLLKQWSIFIGNNVHYSGIEKIFPKAPYWTGKVTKGSVTTGDVTFMLLGEIKRKPNWFWWGFFTTNK